MRATATRPPSPPSPPLSLSSPPASLCVALPPTLSPPLFPPPSLSLSVCLCPPPPSPRHWMSTLLPFSDDADAILDLTTSCVRPFPHSDVADVVSTMHTVWGPQHRLVESCSWGLESERGGRETHGHYLQAFSVL